MTEGELKLDFAGAPFEVTPGMTFGRIADLVLDDLNPYMHRLCGRFDLAGVQWTLQNVGSSAPLVVVDSRGQRSTVVPGGAALLNPPSGTISLVAGPTPYELAFTIAGAAAEAATDDDQMETAGPATANFGADLTARELCYLSSFARPRLTGQGRTVPSFAEVAAEWGVSERTVENTMRRVRTKMRESGVRQVDTIDNLVDQLLARGAVTHRDLASAEPSQSATS